MSRDLWAWGAIGAHAARRGRQCFTLALGCSPVPTGKLLIVWTAGGRLVGPSEAYWSAAYHGWTGELDHATEYSSREQADPDLRDARESVQRGVQRGAVELREVG